MLVSSIGSSRSGEVHHTSESGLIPSSVAADVRIVC